ncbi:MAG: tyrosine-type recombinase/integrase [Deltaproteobacteria bacterium]|nr:tyrosine-type recombinase/integrase [Deltaproteobacteria bacterium]
MNQSFKRIAPHLYKRQYQNASGDWSTRFYGIFTTWKGNRITFPLGENLDAARDKLGVLHKRNDAEYDFDRVREDKKKAKIKGMTVAEWLDRYIVLMKDKKSGKTVKTYSVHLKRLLGSIPLQDMNKVRIMEYKNRRLAESVVRHGKPIEGKRIKGATVNREISCLIAALNLAHDGGLCEEPSNVKKESEEARERILADAEYRALLDTSPRWLQRILIAANEAALDRGVLLTLTWDDIKPGLVVVRGGRAKTGVKQRVGISPALKEVLDELRAECERIPNTEHRVFTKDGKPVSGNVLRYAFEKALQDAKIEDFQFRDFRHCARTRWAADGLPYEVAEGGLGHKLPGMHGRYTNLTDDQVRQAFGEMFTSCLHRKTGTSGSYY